MRVVVLGAGGMGRYAARTAAAFDFVEELVVADLDAAAASRLAEELSGRTRGVRVDVTEPADLAALLRGTHVVLNTVGPFFRFGPPVLRAAIDAGCHYLDINDDWESTEAMLALDEAARARGVTAVIGVGASPGISNLLATTAIAELDTADAIHPGFDLDAAMPETRGERPSAATVHGLHQLTGRIRVFDEGRLADERPLRRVDFDYPGLGPRTAWTMGHPEAITLPRSYPSLRRSLIVMTMERTNLWAVRGLAVLIDTGLLSLARAARWVERLEGVGKPAKTPADYIRELVESRSPKLPPLFAVALGRKDGRPASAAAAVLSAPPVGMGGATGVPLAVGLAVLRPDGDVRRGVFPPEAIFDARTFFDRLAPYCAPAKTGAAELVLVSRSWEDVDLREVLRETQGRSTDG
jgi:saccharopine dehydrogenase-like NADP-dependent oxidoreductase